MFYFSSDHHFFHRNVIRYCSRPFGSVDEMHQHFITCWNSTVTNNDIVYYLGDFGFAPKSVLREILSKLKRKKIILLRGNHDKGEKSMLEIGFDEVHKYLELNLNGKKMFLSHVPMCTVYHDIMICGHVHEKMKVNGNIVNVGVDVWDYCPVSLDRILSLILDKNSIKYMDISVDGKK